MAGWTCAGCTTVYTVGAAKCPQCGSTERADRPGGAVLPSVTVACGNGACQHEGRERRVYLRTAAPGVLELPRLACAGCGYDMPTVTPWPPVLGVEDEMAKITVHGGPSNAASDEPEAGEDVSAGTSSSTSSEKESNSPEPSEKTRPSRARKMASPSKKDRTESSSARGTDGARDAGLSDSDEAGA